MTEVAASELGVRWHGLRTLIHPMRARLRERAFWLIQASVFAITGVHIGLEAIGFTVDERALVLGLHHIPVVLYLLPIAYAGLRYGLEGAVLTGAWCLILTIPNMVLWHSHSWEWAGEVIYVGLVVTIGIVIAVPVERERRRSEELAATSRRLALLNDLGSELVATAKLEPSIERVLTRLTGVLDIDAAGVVTQVEGVAEVVAAAGPIPSAVRSVELFRHDGRTDGHVVTFPLLDDDAGLLVVRFNEARCLSADDHEILRAVADRIGTAIDNATLHRREREQLRRYVRGVTRAQEEERRRVALDLHDTTTQDLIQLNRKLDDLADRTSDKEVEEDLAAIRSTTAVMLDGLRRLSRDLRPSVLDDLGLAAAVEWLAIDLRSRNMDVEMRTTGSKRRLAQEVELAIFRVAQEALRNVERHARADHVIVELSFADDSVSVDISDDGEGFERHDTADAGRSAEPRLGILGMEERTQLVGGSLEIQSLPGQGTQVRVLVPTG